MAFPIHEYLVPVPAYEPGGGFERVETKFTNGLPHRIELDANSNLTVLLANGLANTWRDSDPEIMVDQALEQRLPRPDTPASTEGPALSNVPGFVIVRSGRSVRAAVPLVAGLQQTIALRDHKSTELLELRILDWNIYAGNMRGAGDYGGNLTVAWRRAEKAAADYSTPPVNPYLKPRLKPIYRMISTLGLRRPRIMTRFTARQAALKLKVFS